MHFTVERRRLIKILEAARRKLPGQKIKDTHVRLFACAARVFVEANGVTGGEEALVLQNGDCRVALEPFLGVLKTYSPRKNVTIMVDENALHLYTSSLSVTDYKHQASPPADFLIGRVTDTWITGGKYSDTNE
jgi:hypothetical protein